MGYFYFTAVHCKNEHITNAMAKKYAGQTFVFSYWYEKEQKRCISPGIIGRIETSYTNNWVEFSCEQITGSGLADLEEKERANEYCNIVYGMLRNEQYFDYALCGVEVAEFRELEELKEELLKENIVKWDGLVVSKELIKELNLEENKIFEEFSSTHKWIPKKLH